MLRPLLAKLLPLVLLLALVAYVTVKLLGVPVRHPSDTSPAEEGTKALARGDLAEAGRGASALEEDFPQAAHLLRGRIWMARANQLRRRARHAPPYQEAQAAGQMLLAGAGLSDHPAVVRAAVWLSACLVQQPQAVPAADRRAWRRALREFARVRDDGPTGVDAGLLAAACLVSLDQRPLAVAGLEALAKRHPEEKEVHRLLAALLIDLNAFKAAIGHLRAWGELDPEDGRPYRWIGYFHKEFGNPYEAGRSSRAAIGAYEEALRRRLEPGMRREVVEELAGVFINIQGNWRKALETLDQCPEPFRDAPEIVTLRADCLSRLDRTREAVRLLDDTLRRHPRFPTALLLRAKIYRNEDEPRRALPLLERAVTADGYKEIEMIRQQLAEVYKELGDPLRAAEQHRLYEEERGLREDQGNWTQEAINRPWDDRIRYQLGLLTLKLSQPREAAMWFKAAVMANPDNHLARQALAGLGTGPAASRGSGAGGSD